MDGVTAVIVSYHRDLYLFSRCLDSIQRHGTELKSILVIINDESSVVKHFQEVAQGDPRVQILHWSEVAAWPSHQRLTWWSQQYFKLAVSKIVATPWYLLIDSDDVLIKDLNERTLFENGRARCLFEKLGAIRDSKTPELIRWLRRAREFAGISMQLDRTMGNLTPMMMHTATVRDLFSNIDTSFFVGTKDAQDMSLEFYLYHSWLERLGSFEKLYQPVENLGYALDKRGNQS